MHTTTSVRTLSGPEILRPRDVRALLAAPDRRTARGKRDACLLAVLALGGLRIGEAVGLLAQNVEVLEGMVRVTTRTFKSQGRARTVSVSGLGARLIHDHLEWREPRFWLFPGRRNEHLSTSQGKRIVKGYLRKIGRGDLHTHSLRHTVGAMVTRQTGSIHITQKVLGHASPAVTSRYYAPWDTSDADAAARAIAEAVKGGGPGRRKAG